MSNLRDGIDDELTNTPTRRTSPARKCRSLSVTPLKLDAAHQTQEYSKATAITKCRGTSPSKSNITSTTKTTTTSKVIRPPKATTKEIRKITPSNRKTNVGTSSTATTSAGIYDKQPYSGGKDLEVISDIQHMFDDMITSKVLSNDRYTTLLCNLITDRKSVV